MFHDFIQHLYRRQHVDHHQKRTKYQVWKALSSLNAWLHIVALMVDSKQSLDHVTRGAPLLVSALFLDATGIVRGRATGAEKGGVYPSGSTSFKFALSSVCPCPAIVCNSWQDCSGVARELILIHNSQLYRNPCPKTRSLIFLVRRARFRHILRDLSTRAPTVDEADEGGPLTATGETGHLFFSDDCVYAKNEATTAAAGLREAAIVQMTELGLSKSWSDFVLCRAGGFNIGAAVAYCIERSRGIEKLLAEEHERSQPFRSLQLQLHPRPSSNNSMSSY